MQVFGKQAADRERMIYDRLKEYANNKESGIFHVGDAKRLCPELYEDEVEIAFGDMRAAQLFEIAPGYYMTSPGYYRFPGSKDYGIKTKPKWEITVHYTEFRHDPEKVRFRREVELDGNDYGLDILGLYKLADSILIGYMRCARATGWKIKFYWNQIITKRQGFYHNVEKGYYSKNRGDFEVRFWEIKDDCEQEKRRNPKG